MKLPFPNINAIRVLLCLVLSAACSFISLDELRAQGYGAIQAVRQRVEGLGGPGAPPGAPGSGGQRPGSVPGAPPAKVDLTFVPPNIATLAILRPAQIVTSPTTQIFPVEAAAAFSRVSLGMDPADIDEVIAFSDISNAGIPAKGAVFKFNKPFRAVNLPPSLVAGTKLSDFNGKKYLQSSASGGMSFYGADNKTLIVASEDLLKKAVQGAGQPKSGGILDRVRDMPASDDFIAILDIASLRSNPMVQAMLPMMLAHAKAPPETKQMIDSISMLEVEANLVSRGPISILLHFNDDAGAQQFQTTLESKKADVTAKLFGEIPQTGDPISQARGQWRDRLMQKYWPQQSGPDVKFHIDGDDPLQQQLLGMAVGAGLYAKFSSTIESMEKNAPTAAPTASATSPPGAPGGPPPQ